MRAESGPSCLEDGAGLVVAALVAVGHLLVEGARPLADRLAAAAVEQRLLAAGVDLEDGVFGEQLRVAVRVLAVVGPRVVPDHLEDCEPVLDAHRCPPFSGRLVVVACTAEAGVAARAVGGVRTARGYTVAVAVGAVAEVRAASDDARAALGRAGGVFRRAVAAARCGGSSGCTSPRTTPRRCPRCCRGRSRWARRRARARFRGSRRPPCCAPGSRPARCCSAARRRARARRPRGSDAPRGRRGPRTPTRPRWGGACRPTRSRPSRPARRRAPPGGPCAPRRPRRGPRGGASRRRRPAATRASRRARASAGRAPAGTAGRRTTSRSARRPCDGPRRRRTPRTARS